jgi:hypothetical protein
MPMENMKAESLTESSIPTRISDATPITNHARHSSADLLPSEILRISRNGTGTSVWGALLLVIVILDKVDWEANVSHFDISPSDIRNIARLTEHTLESRSHERVVDESVFKSIVTAGAGGAGNRKTMGARGDNVAHGNIGCRGRYIDYIVTIVDLKCIN